MAAVGGAIQRLAVARLGRGFVPLGLLCLVGLGEMLTGRGRGWIPAAGGPLAAGVMLAYGMRVVQQAFGRPLRPWMRVVSVAGLLPPALGLYVFGWRGLRALAMWDDTGAGLAALLFTLLGVWILRAWLKLVELGRLADTMALGTTDGKGRGS